jgi:hypothetical protein
MLKYRWAAVIAIASLGSAACLAMSALGTAATTESTRGAPMQAKPNPCDYGVLTKRLLRSRSLRLGRRAFRGGRLLSARPMCSSSCNVISTSGGRPPMEMWTTVEWCWNGQVVTYVGPPGGSTGHSGGGYWGTDGYYSYFDWDGYTRWSYCCVGGYQYDIYKTGRWRCTFNCGSTNYACVHNALHLRANGSYSVRPSDVEHC